VRHSYYTIDVKKMFTYIYLLLLIGFANTAEEITLAADVWCPYNCQPGTEKPGYMIEIAQRVLGSAGYTVSYVAVPWARTIHGARNGHYDGIIAAGREETPDFVFPEASFGIARHTFFAQPNSSWQYAGITDLNQITSGIRKMRETGELLEIIEQYGLEDWE
jgi:polar amino acid transport system substrate-binding protein